MIIERLEDDFPYNRHERSTDEEMPLALHMRMKNQGEEVRLRLRRVPTLKTRSLTANGIVEHDISSIKVNIISIIIIIIIINLVQDYRSNILIGGHGFQRDVIRTGNVAFSYIDYKSISA